MRRLTHSSILICLISYMLIIMTFGVSHATDCRVTRLIDGDTVLCQDNSRIRLAAIDAPEKRQRYGSDATRFLSNMISGKTITYTSKKKDQYGRIIARIYVGDTDVCVEMVRHGYAWAYMTKDKDILSAQTQAENDKAGLWHDSNPTPPWKFRSKK